MFFTSIKVASRWRTPLEVAPEGVLTWREEWREPYIVESHVEANDYRVKIGSETKMYHVNMLKKYIAREPEVDVVHTSNKDDNTIAVAGVIYQDTAGGSTGLSSERRSSRHQNR